MSVLALQKGIIYGPIKSKRLGRSLGINLLPCDNKVCSFNCIYCHYGPTNLLETSQGLLQKVKFPSITDVLQEVENVLQSEIGFDYITFSGNGEPMLHPQFREIAAEIKALKERFRPNVSLTLLTNSSLVRQNDIVDSIVSIEFPIFKLDCGDEKTFRSINRPAPDLKISEIVAGLKRLAKKFKITIQTVFINGLTPNFANQAFENWLVAIKDIKPAAIQIYSTDRPVADDRIKMLSKTQLEELAKTINQRTYILTTAYFSD